MQNKSLILNVVLAIVALVLGVRLATGTKPVEKTESPEKAVLETIATRTSIRAYEARPVEKEKVEEMLRAAMAAPTAMNKQPWHFIVVDQRSVIDSLSAANPRAKMLETAPLAIVVCGDMDKAIEGGGRDFWIQDAIRSDRKPPPCSPCYGVRSRVDRCISRGRALQIPRPDTVIAR